MTTVLSAFSGKTILVVEDELLIGLALVEKLEGVGATVVGPAASVAEAEKLLKRNEIDGALLDINLVNGETSFVLADVLRVLERPFVFVSSMTRAAVPESYRDRLIDKLATLDQVGSLLFAFA